VKINTNGFNSTFSGSFSGAGGLAKSGSGTLALIGASSFSGATVVNAGTLALTTGGLRTTTLGNTAITVAAGAAFVPRLGAVAFSNMVNAGTTGTGTAGASLTLEPGSALNMANSPIVTFNLRQENAFAGPAFTIGGASGIAPMLTFDIGNGATGPDMINVTGNVTVLATGARITIDALAGDTSLTSGSYDLIASAGGFSGTGGNHLTLTDTTLLVDGTTYDFSLANSTVDDEVLTVSVAPAAAAVPDQSIAYREDSREAALSNPPGGAALVTTAAVPEPGTTMSLLSAMGVTAAWLLRRRRN
jgi:autotransporter-associated beta strand protein